LIKSLSTRGEGRRLSRWEVEGETKCQFPDKEMADIQNGEKTGDGATKTRNYPLLTDEVRKGMRWGKHAKQRTSKQYKELPGYMGINKGEFSLNLGFFLELFCQRTRHCNFAAKPVNKLS